MTETDDLQEMLPGSEPVLKQKSLVRRLPTPMQNLVHHGLAQGLKLPGDVSVGYSSQDDPFEGMKDERDRMLEETNAYQTESENFEKTLLDKEVPMKAMTQFMVHSEKTLDRLKMEKSFLMKKKKVLVFYSWKTTTSSGRITNKQLKHMPSVYLRFSFSVK